MLLGMLGNKVGMTQIFDDSGNVVPVTVLSVGPCFVTQIKTTETDGYNAIQLGYNEILPKKLKKPQQGHLKKSLTNSINEITLISGKYLREYKIKETKQFVLGQSFTVEIFKDFNFITVIGKSIGKGFAGNQKRHNFGRGPMTHGSKNHRAPGSIGAGTTPGRVIPGKKMAGQLGDKKITTKNLKIIKIDNKQNLILVKGSVPGKPGNLISLQFLK
jgi:large subunit ribosomal protein L3